jgi:hypothetical protein
MNKREEKTVKAKMVKWEMKMKMMKKKKERDKDKKVKTDKTISSMNKIKSHSSKKARNQPRKESDIIH